MDHKLSKRLIRLLTRVRKIPARYLFSFQGFLLLLYAITAGIFFLAPFLALTWSARPFLGFVVEQTLVVSDASGNRWSGEILRSSHPVRLTAVGSQPVATTAEYDHIVSHLYPGEEVQITTVSPDGHVRTSPSLEAGRFPLIDLLRMFWLPYIVGLVYLILGSWVFRLRYYSRSGRAFAYFCACAALVNGLLFDLTTTHIATALWTIAMAQQGGALISLALLFPEPWVPLKRRSWLRFLPYTVSALLAIWGLFAIFDLDQPWNYFLPWRFSYLYTFSGIAFFVALMIYRLRTDPPGIVRQQSRIILLGAVVAFTPLSVWLASSQFPIGISWNPAVFLPLLLLFPLSIAFAILRYHLWDIDAIINRTLVYGLLTVLLGLLYLGCVYVSQQFLDIFMRQPSNLAALASTLSVAIVFNPLRGVVQNFIDRRFYRRKYDIAQTLAAFGLSLRDEVDLDRLVDRLQGVVVETIQPVYVYTWLAEPAGYRVYPAQLKDPVQLPMNQLVSYNDALVHQFQTIPGVLRVGRLDLDSIALQQLKANGVEIAVPLVSQGELVGWLALGARRSEQDYSVDDGDLLTNLAIQAAPAVRVARMVSQQRAESLRQERLNTELRLARNIQHAMLPDHLPELPGWRVAAHYQPANVVGGDFYDFVHFKDGRLGILIGDVTDKGIPAAMVMATTRTLLRAVAQADASPGQVLAKVNNLLKPDIPSGMFVTCMYAILDPLTGQLQYANAGQNLPYRRMKGRVGELYATGMPLGLMPDMDYEEKETCIEVGECLLFYSDGLVEAHSPEREMYGANRLLSWIKVNDGGGPEMVECLLEDLSGFTGPGWAQEDDITLVVFKRMEATH
jgi:serine phosphatase RsbU (regulator of sigma subunit)